MGDARHEAANEKTVKLVFLHGDLGMFDQKRIEDKLPAPESGLRLVIDCSAVTSMDSTIIALLMRYRQRLQIAGGDPSNIVVLATPRLERLFELTGISRAMTVLPARPE